MMMKAAAMAMRNRSMVQRMTWKRLAPLLFPLPLVAPLTRRL